MKNWFQKQWARLQPASPPPAPPSAPPSASAPAALAAPGETPAAGTLLMELSSGHLPRQLAALEQVQQAHASDTALTMAVHACARQSRKPALRVAARAVLERLDGAGHDHAGHGEAMSGGATLVALLSPNGLQRERALRQLSPGQIQGPVLSAVLLRLNDWVPQVREAAQQVLQQLAPALAFDQLQAVLPALKALERGRRADHSASLALIRRSLVQQVQGMDDVQRQRMHQQVRSGPPALAHFAFDVLLHWAQAKNPEQGSEQGAEQALSDVLASGLQARQPVISRRAVQRVHKLPADAQAPLYALALRSRHARTRLGALRALGQGWDAQAASAMPVADLPEWLRNSLLDPNASVRYLALMLCGGPSEALLAHAQAALQGSHTSAQTAPHTAAQRVAALGLLADLGLPAARPLVREALRDALPSVRQAAYAAALQLQAADTDTLLLSALEDASAKVFATALRHARRGGHSPTLAALQPHLQGTGSHESAQHWLRLLQLMAHGNPWDRLIVLLSVPRAALAQTQDGAPHPHVLMLRQAGAHWLSSVKGCFVPPTPAQTTRIETLLPQADTRALFGRSARQLAETLRTQGLADFSVPRES